MSDYPSGGTPPTTITEDSPLWNCHTMGNHVCGTQAHPNTGSAYTGDLAGIGGLGLFLGLTLIICARIKRAVAKGTQT